MQNGEDQSLLRSASPRRSWCRGNAVISDEERLAGEEIREICLSELWRSLRSTEIGDP